MNTIDDLRATLAGHAELHDDHLTDRVRAVNGRVRTVRRRRAAVAGGTAAVVLAGVVGGVAIVNRPDPANDNLLAGAPVPETLASTGHTFEFVDGYESEPGEETVTVTLPKSDAPRLVSWATEGDDQAVLVKDGSQRFESSRPDFTDYVLVYNGEHRKITVTGHTAVGLAVYELSGAHPDGYTAQGVTFRQDIAGSSLLGAVIGEPGDNEVSVDVTLDEGKPTWSELCDLRPDATPNRIEDPEAYISLSADGHDLSTISCGYGELTDPMLDPGAGGGSLVGPFRLGGRTYEAGDEVTFSARLTDEDGNLISEPGAVIGLGIYDAPRSGVVEVGGVKVDETVEWGGHVWQLTHTEVTALPAEDWTADVPPSDERLLVGTAHRYGDHNVAADLYQDGEIYETVTSFGAGWGLGRVLPPDVQTMGVTTKGGSEGTVALLFYELIR